LDDLSLTKLHDVVREQYPNEYKLRYAITEEREETVCRREPRKDREEIKRLSQSGDIIEN
jgi:hypothetical protein